MDRPRRRIGSSDLEVCGLAFGTNVLGWTADRETSFALLDAYLEGGGDFVDTADSYSFWAPGNAGGEAETILGEWFASRSVRDRVTLATKVSQHPEFAGIDPVTIERGLAASLGRLGVEHIDLYYAHFDEPNKPLAPTVEAFSRHVDAGTVRAYGISNFSPARIALWLRIADDAGLHRPVAIQPPYNLVQREIETDLVPLALGEGLGLVTYWALARGFLTGKYRTGASDADSPRAEPAAAYLTHQGRRILATLDRISEAHGTSQAAIAIAWVAAQPGVVAPIASARNTGQLATVLTALDVELTAADLADLDAVSR